jgi:hypothetical protein
LSHLFFEIPVIFSSENQRLYFPKVTLTPVNTKEIQTYYVEFPHISFNETLLSSGRSEINKLYVTRKNGRLVIVDLDP